MFRRFHDGHDDDDDNDRDTDTDDDAHLSVCQNGVHIAEVALTDLHVFPPGSGESGPSISMKNCVQEYMHLPHIL